jgi:hypothetical protein
MTVNEGDAVQLVHSPDLINRAQRFLVAGVAVLGAGLVAVAVHPTTPGMPNVQHRAVQLTAGEEDWSQVLATTEDNLSALESQAATANSDLSSALGTELSGFETQISNAFTGVESGLQNSISGGWYGSDDGYVFGLFPGSVTGPDGTETGSTLQEISTALEQGNALNAFSYFDTWSLETVDHTLKPLLSPLLDETSKGATTLGIPSELSQTFTNVLEEFGTYNEVKALGDALLAPELSVAFGLSNDLDGIATDLSTGNSTQALTDLSNLSSDLTGDLLNGWTDTSAGSTEPFTGLLNSGSLLDELLVTWPTQLATALGESTAPAAADAVSSSLPDLFSGLVSF